MAIASDTDGTDLTIRPQLSVEYVTSYIRQRLGGGGFEVELDDLQYQEAMKDALRLYSTRKPKWEAAGIDVSTQIRAYPVGHDVGLGIFDVQFLQPDVGVSAMFYANLLDAAPIKPSTMDSYDLFLRWRKTFMRVTSTLGRWEWLEKSNTLMIYAPIEAMKCCYFWHVPHSLKSIPLRNHPWFLDYASAKAKMALGEVRSKYQGALPGPARDLQLNGDALKAEAAAEITLLEQRLLTMQAEHPPLFS